MSSRFESRIIDQLENLVSTSTVSSLLLRQVALLALRYRLSSLFRSQSRLMSASSPSSSNSPSPPTPTTPSNQEASNTPSEADKKRQHRAEKKAEQQRRKEERKRIALETGIDPALLPEAIGRGVLPNGKIQPKGFKPREWAKVPRKDGEDDGKESRKLSIMSWNVSFTSRQVPTVDPQADHTSRCISSDACASPRS